MTTTIEARECFALFLAINGGVTKVGEDGVYTQAGTAVSADLAEMFDGLLGRGLVTLAWRSSGGLRRVCITRAGREMHTALFSGDVAAISALRTKLAQVPADLATDPAYQCDHCVPGYRHVIGSDGEQRSVVPGCPDGCARISAGLR